jgi:tetratricopeptide (TPR) repeat protein
MLHPLVDPDVFIHLRDGRHWVESNFHIDKEPFAYTAAEKPLEKAEWLFRIGIYLTWKLGGYALITIVKALLITLAFLFYGGLLYRRWPNLGVTAVLMGLSILAVWTRIAPERPQLFTYLFLPWAIHLLENYRFCSHPFRSHEAKKLLLIPCLVVPWANLHPGFVILFLFLGAFSLDYLVTYIKTRESHSLQQFGGIVLLTTAVFLAGLLNPMGFSLYTFVAKAMGNQNFLQTIVEWMPPEFHRKPVFFFLLGVVWVIQLFSIRRTRLSDFCLLLLFTYFALKSRRNISLFLVAAMPALIAHLRYLQQTWFPGLNLTFQKRRTWLWLGSASLGALLIFLTSVGYAFRLGQFPDYHPTQGLAWIESQNLQGRLFAPLHWGGYIGWMTEGKQKVFMDGRLPTFAGKIFTDYGHIIYGNTTHCLPTLDEHNIQILLVSPKSYYSLFQQLNNSDQWVLVYWDHVSQIFVRRVGPNAAIAKTHAYHAIDPNATPYTNPQEADRALAEIERAHLAAPDSFLPLFFKGDLLLQQGKLSEASIILADVLKQKPKHAHTLFSLGVISMQNDHLKQAEHYFKTALRYNQDKPFQAKTQLSLASTLRQNPLRLQQALKHAKKALALMPQWPAAEQLIQKLEAFK